jgi:gluconate 2-dehydrogenase subunit 3-like protein
MASNENKREKTRSVEDLTRREWLLRLGETVALVGFSGVAGQAEEAAASLLAGPAQPALPPGLYEPSNDHLSHALMADEQFHPVPPDTETDYVSPRSGAFQPQFFSPPEFQIVRRIVKLMLGDVAELSSAGTAEKKTGLQIVDEVAEWLDLTVFSAAEVREAARRMAPEHRLLAVHHFGAAAVEEVENNEAQKICREGLKWLTDQAEGGDFVKLSEEQQIQLLGRISDDRADKSAQNEGTRFFRLIKAGVVRGFYTSRLGLKELDYKGNAFYAESPGCSGQPT